MRDKVSKKGGGIVMKFPKILTVVAAILLATCAVVAANSMNSVDWKSRVVTVTGESVAPPNAVSQAQARAMASRGARADAYRNLAETINGVRVEGETTVENMITTKDTIRLRVDATIKGARVIDEKAMSDGSYRVTMQVPLFGVSNSLASAVFEKDYAVEPFPDPVFDVESSAANRTYQPSTNYNPVPTTPYQSPLSRMAVLTNYNLQNLQSYSTTTNAPTYQQPTQNSQPTQQAARKTVADYAAMAEGGYTGLVVDCRGLELQPVMSPVIMNVNGTKIYGHKNLDIDKVISMGMADYVDNTGSADRAGDKPLVVKAVSLENFNSNPVVAISDSNRILIENYASKFLKDLKVVFLFDNNGF